jgi:hypothetical protein
MFFGVHATLTYSIGMAGRDGECAGASFRLCQEYASPDYGRGRRHRLTSWAARTAYKLVARASMTACSAVLMWSVHAMRESTASRVPLPGAGGPSGFAVALFSVPAGEQTPALRLGAVPARLTSAQTLVPAPATSVLRRKPLHNRRSVANSLTNCSLVHICILISLLYPSFSSPL